MKKRLYKTRPFIMLLVAVLALGGLFFFLIWNIAIPDVATLSNRKVVASTQIYDRTGAVLLYDIHGPTQRRILASNEIPNHVKKAAIAIEDKNFYSHHGISLPSIIRAFVINFLQGRIAQGGSTITQQLVKNALLGPEKRYWRKIKEVALAIKIERRYTKDEILALYLNEVPYGASIYGVESAARGFFGVSAQNLSVAQGAYLASLPKAPTYFSPYGSHRKELDARKNIVLKKMRELDFITEDEYQKASQEAVTFLPTAQGSIQAPHFVMFVREYLAQKYGEETLQQEGLRVITTIDFELQQKAEEIIARRAEENTKNFNAKNAGLVAIDPRTGQILVMVGSKDFFDVENDGNFNVTTALRQPGSAIKPFIYAQAFREGYTPDTVVFDLPTEFHPQCPASADGIAEYCYHPQNFDNKFKGPISLREALAQSINVPSVKVLYLAGLHDSLDLSKQMGISTLNDPDRYGLTLVLGGGEVQLLELTSAYGIFANDGMRLNPTPIMRVEDGQGNVLEEFRADPRPALDTNVSRMISDVLSDNEARSPAFGAESALFFPDRDVAAKTGTTNDFRDAWIVGFTPNIAVGAWAGNNDNSSMEKRVAGFIVAPMWNEFMQEVFKKLPSESFQAPDIPRPEIPMLRGLWQGGISYTIDKISKKIATEFTPPDLQEEKVVRNIHSILYWLNRSNDPQFINWETPVRNWATSRGFFDQNSTDIIPRETDDVHIPSKFPRITLSQNIIEITNQNTVSVEFQATGVFPIVQTDIFFNGTLINSTKQTQFTQRINITDMKDFTEENKLVFHTHDSVGNTSKAEVLIKVAQQ